SRGRSFRHSLNEALSSRANRSALEASPCITLEVARRDSSTSVGMTAIVTRAGFLSSVQELGRTGLREFGVSLSGALDSFGLRVANLLVGNEEDAAGVEITFGGLQLQFNDERTVAWCGGEFDARVGSKSLPVGHAARVHAGEQVKFGRPNAGCRCWLAISGGIEIAPVLGSRSTDLRAGF